MSRARRWLGLGILSGLVTLAAAPAAPAAVVISEVYGGGGNSGATLRQDFIELYNNGSTAVDLTGWSVQYASAAGTIWQLTALTGSIPAGGNYLVQEAAGAGGAVDLPAPDATGTIAMSGTAGKVALVGTQTGLTTGCPTGSPIVDLVGYGTTASCFEGTGPTPAPSNTTSAKRQGNGATDTDQNATDFTAGAPDPFNSAGQGPVTEVPPAVQSTTPANGASGVAASTNVTVNFTEPVTVADGAIGLTCATSGAHPGAVTGGPTSFTLDPATDLTAGEQCTIAVTAAGVSDQDGIAPATMAADFSATFTVADPAVCGTPATGIHAVQGAGAASPIAGQTVTVEGVVVGDYQGAGEFGGFYLQEEAADADADPLTSEGIFVFSTAVAVAPGDTVRVTGTALEFAGLTELSPVTGIQVCASGATIVPTAFALPFASPADEEALEGMLVTLDQTLTATEVFNLGRFGEVSLSGVGRLYTPTAVATPGAAAQAQLAQNARSRIVLDDGVNLQNIDPTRYPQGGLSASNTLRVGDTLPGLTGVMDFRFTAYRIQPIGPLIWSHDNARTPAPEPVGGNLKVASFNVLNYFNGDGLGGGFPTPRGATTPEELARQRAKIVSAITALDADVVGLMEIENDAPPMSALEDLVAGLNASAGAGTYAFVDTGVIGTDAIKVALIYRPASVSPVGAFATITSAVDPRFVDTLNRPSLAQTFQRADGARLTVVVNHLKSKGSDCDDVGDPDTGDGQGNCNVTRTNAAAALVDWLATDPTGSGDPDVLLIGDMNSYTFEDPIRTFVDGGFVNLVRQFGGLTPYSYVFNGESGYLDHALASPSLAAQATGTADWHINPDEPIALDYNVEFKTPNQVTTFYDPGPYRASDHDPVVIGLELAGAPGVDAGGPYAVGEGGSVSVSASGSGGTAYAWDLDGDGTFETTGQTATFSAAALDGPASRTIAVRLSGPGGTATDAAAVEVSNVAPTVAVAGPATAVIGAATSWRFTTSDPAPADEAAGFTLHIDWGDGTPLQVVTGPSPQDVAHTYATAGDRTVSVTATDDDGGTSAAATASVTAFGAALQPDVCTPGRQALVVVGTGAADQIALRPASGGRVEVRFGGAPIGTFAPTGQLVVSGLGGGDGVTVDTALARRAIVYGGAGGDTLQTGSGSATLVGGAGADTLSSGAGRDVLIGGGDGDTLGGGNGDDILVAGTTSYDAETPAGQRALCAITAEWTRTSTPYVLRIAHLTGLLPGGLNGSAVLRPSGAGRTVFDDGAVDRLTGGNADDWFLLNVAGAGARDTSDRRLLEVALDT